jgi:hypothetical protein
MNHKLFNSRILIVIISLIVILILYFFPFQIEYSYKTYAKLLPSQQWVVMKGNDGLYISSVKDFSKGINSSYLVNQFERGASVEVTLNPGLRSNQFVENGDTLGVIYSSSNLQRFIELQGLLKTAKAELNAGLSGEKESVIKQAEQNLQLSISETDKQAKVAERLQQLFDKKLVSEEEYQLAADQLRSLKISVELRRAQLEGFKTGLKDSEVQRIKVYIHTIEDQLEVLQKQLQQFNIIAPFAGKIERCFSNDTLLILSDKEKYLVLIPVGQDERNYLLPDSRISIELGGKIRNATLLDVNNSIEIVNNKQCVTYTALLEDNEEASYGMVVPVELKGRMLTIFEYISALLKSES